MTNRLESLNAFREGVKSVKVHFSALERRIFKAGFNAATREASNLAVESGDTALALAIMRLKADEP